jgi:hypothetical protein
MTTVIIDDNNVQAKHLLNYIGTLPFVKFKETKPNTKAKSKWETAIAEGAVTVDEFFGEVRRQIKDHYDSHA